MSVWHIRGENRLSGSCTVQGAKNAVLPIMAASVLAPCETELTNVPQLLDVSATGGILRGLGCVFQRAGDTVYIDSSGLRDSSVPPDLMRRMRSSILFAGALLGRCGQAEITAPGGCALGSRPIDLHLLALRQLGAEIISQGESILCRSDGLRGARIVFPFPSVGATENAMIAACAAKGGSVIVNAAREPEIRDLQDYLNALGANISGAGSSEIYIEGFSPRPRVGHRIMTDRMASATLLCAAAASGGDIELRGVEPEYFDTVIRSLSECGCDIMSTSRSVRLRSEGVLAAPSPVVTGPYPGFPTDAQPLLLAACLKAKGVSVFTERVFESRFRYLEELARMGASVHTQGATAYVMGVAELSGAPVTACDLRGGAALVIAALSASGETVMSDDGYIARGYDALDRQLSQLGADIITV